MLSTGQEFQFKIKNIDPRSVVTTLLLEGKNQVLIHLVARLHLVLRRKPPKVHTRRDMNSHGLVANQLNRTGVLQVNEVKLKF